MIELEHALLDLGEHLDHPRPRDLPARVAAMIGVEMPARRGRPMRRRMAIVVAAVIGAAGLAASPAIADWLGLRGVDVQQQPAPVRPELGVPLVLGGPVTLEEASEALGFDVLTPEALGAADEVWLDEGGTTPVVSLVYRSTDDLPAVGVGDVGALLAQFRGSVDEPGILTKFASGATTVERVQIGDGHGLWIDGIHEMAFVDPNGEVVSHRLRLANRVLIWEHGDVTLRLEVAGDRDSAIEIAESVR